MRSEAESPNSIVLAADRHIAASPEVLLRRRRTDPGVGSVSFDVRRYPESDAGCRSRAVECLRPFIPRYRYALVVFDHQGCGSAEAPFADSSRP